LVVGGKMFQSSGNSCFFQTPHLGRRDLSCEIWILRKILEISSVQRISMDIHTWSKNIVDPAVDHFPSGK
jgi:hypothetical protein